MSESLTCQFCLKDFGSKGNLKRHQASAIYCLQIQNQTKTKAEAKKVIETFSCSSCGSRFTRKDSLSIHIANCKSQIATEQLKDLYEAQKVEIREFKLLMSMRDQTIAERDRTILELKAQVADMINKQQATVLTAITRPTTNVKNTIKNLQVNNLTPLLADEMRSHLPMLTHAHIEDGAAGFARYAVEYPLKDKVMVSDVSRRKLKWKNESETIIEDLDGIELCKKFFEVHREDSRKKIEELMKEVRERHDRAQDEENEEEIKMCDERITKLWDLRRGITRLSKGETDELRTDFVKEVCVKLTPS